jgi:hypothetical protein
MGPGQVGRYDSESVRNGTARFIAFERGGNRRPPRDPLADWRELRVTERRTMVDFAHFVRDLVDVRYNKEAEAVVRVMDNLNTHAIGSLYEAFGPEEARRVAEKLEVHSTPRHGSWPNRAEVEPSVPARQCLDERMEDRTTPAREVAAWEAPRNDKKIGAGWRFTAADARGKLKRLYPAIHG